MFKIASLAGALAIGAGLALAAPANADPVDTDEYLGWLSYAGVSYTSEQDALDQGLALCGKMRDGQFDSLEDDVRDSGVFSYPDTFSGADTHELEAASFSLCPDTAEGLMRYILPGDSPDKAPDFLDLACSVPPVDSPGCTDLPASVAQRLGALDNPATRLQLSYLCMVTLFDHTRPPPPLCE